MRVTIKKSLLLGCASTALFIASDSLAGAESAPTAKFTLSTGLPVLTREIAYDSYNQMLITGDPGSGTVFWDAVSGRQIYFLPRRKDGAELFVVPIPGLKGTFVSNNTDTRVLRFGALTPGSPDWTFANPDELSWNSVLAASPGVVLASNGVGTYLLNASARTHSPVKGLERCYSPRSLFVQQGMRAHLAGCTVAKDIRIVDLNGETSPRLLQATAHAYEVQISADGRYLVALTAADDPPTKFKLEIWVLAGDAIAPQAVIYGPDDGISNFAFEAGEALNLYTTSGFTGHVQHWQCSRESNDLNCRSLLNVKTGEVTYPSAYGIAFVPGGLLYVGRDRDILQLRADTLQQVGKFDLTTHARIQYAGFLGGRGIFATGLDLGTQGSTMALVSRSSDSILADSIPDNSASRGTPPAAPIYEVSTDDATRVVKSNDRYINYSVIDIESSRELTKFNGMYSTFDRSGRFVAFVKNPLGWKSPPELCSIDLDIEGAEPLCHPTEPNFRTYHIAVSENQIAAALASGTKLPNDEYDNAVRIWNRHTGKSEGILPRSKGRVSSLQFSRDSMNLLVAASNVVEWRTFPHPVTERRKFSYADSEGIVARYTGDDSQVIVGFNTGTIRVFDRSVAQPMRELEGHVSGVEVLAVGDLTNGVYKNILLSGGLDGVLRGWDLEACRAQAAPGPCSPLFSLLQRDNRQWIMAANDGRFDTSTFDDGKSLSWVVSDDPLRPLPLEIFTRDYFEPGLLTKLLDGKSFESVSDIATLNRVQPARPEIRVTPDRSDPGVVTVAVKVATNSRGTKGTGVYDLRLFRDDQLVAVSARSAPKADATARPADKLENWRNGHRVLAYRDGRIDSMEVSFPGIRLPRSSKTGRVKFSAYAFNEDRIKSDTAELSVELPKGLPPRASRAYVITIGVSVFEDTGWNLRYAANDAWEAGQELVQSLAALRATSGTARKYEDVVRISLISGTTTRKDEAGRKFSSARKEQIRAVFLKLGGQKVDDSILEQVDSADRLRRVNPEDLIIVLVSTHGMVDKDGVFYFLPQDIGASFSPFKEVDARARQSALSRTVSSEELADWIEGIDAADQVMIIDACHSAASVQSPDFKPGPLGSRGLGQLAFDKGMRVLSATQVNQAAVERDATQMGLLTYALIEDGLRQGKANIDGGDTITLAELLEYAKSRVPEVRRELDNGTLRGTKGVWIYPEGEEGKEMSSLLQQPSLFNFARTDDIEIKTTLVDAVQILSPRPADPGSIRTISHKAAPSSAKTDPLASVAIQPR